jgi:hypothetical protein
MIGILLLAVVLILLFGGLGIAVSPMFLLVGLVLVLLFAGGGYVGRGRGWY